MEKRKIVGVTGAFAGGKSTVAGMLVAMGAVRVDADKIGHAIMDANENVRGALSKMFGADVVSDGKIDRKKIRDKVFSGGGGLEGLNRLMHPLILETIYGEMDSFEGGVLVIDAALLIESGLVDDVDIVVVVRTGHDVCVKRAVIRGASESEAESIISRQMPLSEKLEFADFIIDNNGDIETTKKGVEELWKKIQR